MLKKFISYYKPHKKLFIMDMLASLLVSVIGMVYPVVTNKMLNDYIPNKLYSLIVFSTSDGTNELKFFSFDMHSLIYEALAVLLVTVFESCSAPFRDIVNGFISE